MSNVFLFSHTRRSPAPHTFRIISPLCLSSGPLLCPSLLCSHDRCLSVPLCALRRCVCHHPSSLPSSLLSLPALVSVCSARPPRSLSVSVTQTRCTVGIVHIVEFCHAVSASVLGINSLSFFARCASICTRIELSWRWTVERTDPSECRGAGSRSKRERAASAHIRCMTCEWRVEAHSLLTTIYVWMRMREQSDGDTRTRQ